MTGENQVFKQKSSLSNLEGYMLVNHARMNWKHCLQVFQLDKPTMTSQNDNITDCTWTSGTTVFFFTFLTHSISGFAVFPLTWRGLFLSN